MDDIVFYQPPLAPRSRRLRLPGAMTASHLPPGPTASPACQTVALATTLPQKTHTSDGHCRDAKQDFTTSLNFANRSDDVDDLSVIEKLSSGARQKSLPASAVPNGDDPDSFIDIDELLSSMQQKGPKSVDPDCGGIAVDMANNRTGDGITSSYSGSAMENSQDTIIISDDESVVNEFETHCSDLDVDFGAKSDSDRQHITDSEPAVSDGFGVGAALDSSCLSTNNQDNDNDNDRNNDVADKTQLFLSVARSISVPLEHGPNTQHANKLQVNTDITQQYTSTPRLDCAKQTEAEDKDCNALVEGNVQDDNDTHSTRRPNLPAFSNKNPASDSTVSELQHSQVDHTQALQLGPAAVPSYQLELNNNNPSMRLRRTSGNIYNKRSEQKTDGDGSADDSDDKDYADMSNAGGSRSGGTRYSRKRRRRTKDGEHNSIGRPCTPTIDVSCQPAKATSSSSMLESEEIPIHGYLKLQTIDSKVVYGLTFSQDLLHQPGQTCVPGSRSVLIQLPPQKRDTSTHTRAKKSFSSKENILLRELKEVKCLSWDKITEQFPERSKGTLQVHYSTKVKDRSGTNTTTKKRRRSK